jgi:hypothetical protein
LVEHTTENRGVVGSIPTLAIYVSAGNEQFSSQLRFSSQITMGQIDRRLVAG